MVIRPTRSLKPVKKARMSRGATLRKPSDKPSSKPLCNVHDAEMLYRPEFMRWECLVAECNQVAYPRVEADESGRPTMGRGETELVVVQAEDRVHYFVRSKDNNVMIEITDMVADDIQMRAEYGGPPHMEIKLSTNKTVMM